MPLTADKTESVAIPPSVDLFECRKTGYGGVAAEGKERYQVRLPLLAMVFGLGAQRCRGHLRMSARKLYATLAWRPVAMQDYQKDAVGLMSAV